MDGLLVELMLGEDWLDRAVAAVLRRAKLQRRCRSAALVWTIPWGVPTGFEMHYKGLRGSKIHSNRYTPSPSVIQGSERLLLPLSLTSPGPKRLW